MPGIILFFLTKVFSFSLSTTCSTKSYYYDTSLMACSLCDTSQTASSDYLSCICKPGYAKTAITKYQAKFSCQTCSPQVPSSDGSQCQSCPSTISSNSSECECNGNYEFIEEFSYNTTHLSTKQCLTCSSPNTYTGPNSYSCEKCPDSNMTRIDFQCQCNPNSYYSSENSCIPINDSQVILEQYSIQNSIQMVYTNLQKASGISSYTLQLSDTLNYFYLKAAYFCQMIQDPISCQNLANLCVLQLYNLQTEVCLLYQSITNSRPNTTIDSG